MTWYSRPPMSAATATMMIPLSRRRVLAGHPGEADEDDVHDRQADRVA
jgi:hypothetical protein